MRWIPRLLSLLVATAMLSACAGYQTGKALNAFDSKSFWYSGYGDGESSSNSDATATPDATSGTDSAP